MSRANSLPRWSATNWRRAEADPDGLMVRFADADRVIRELEAARDVALRTCTELTAEVARLTGVATLLRSGAAHG